MLKKNIITFKIDEVEVAFPEKDNLGGIFYERLQNACFKKGYVFRFYTASIDKNYDFNLIVY